VHTDRTAGRRRAATDMAGVGGDFHLYQRPSLASNSWRATTDAILINELPLRDDA
jgi:hypothetical protein